MQNPAIPMFEPYRTLFGLAWFLVRTLDIVSRLRLDDAFDPYSYQSRRFGRVRGMGVRLAVNIRSLEELERRLCDLDDDKLLKWRDSYVSVLNIVPFAVGRRPMMTTCGVNRSIGSSSWPGCAHWPDAATYRRHTLDCSVSDVCCYGFRYSVHGSRCA